MSETAAPFVSSGLASAVFASIRSRCCLAFLSEGLEQTRPLAAADWLKLSNRCAWVMGVACWVTSFRR